MINLGLSSADQRKFEAALSSSNPRRIIDVAVTITDLEHGHISTVSDRLLDGQVNIDTTAEVSRSATLTLLDPDHTVGFDSDDPLDGQAYLDRMIRVEYGVYVDEVGWVRVPIFHGPVVGVSRDADVLEVEAHGKEALARRASWKPRSFAKGLTRVGVIRAIMTELAGENRFILPSGWTARLAKPLSLGRQSSPWSHALILANSMRAQIFYDGAGNLRLRKRPVRHVYTFRDGPGGVITTAPKLAYEDRDLINTVHVKGGVPKGAKSKVESAAYVPSWHAQSPRRMGRNGVARYLVEVIEDDTLRTQKAADSAASRRIRELLLSTATVSFDCLPIIHLEEDDVVRIESEALSMTFRINQMSIPLAHSGVASVGYLRRVTFRGKVPARRPVRYK